ncbi:hypothetical protein TW81_13460 [Vibrio galatheae]|uniref:Uncharacterized protein n=1 Tax=Vibrio galatheae TaxID=579748 RepID=A0A0F4NK35_9VIBR|nr:hypothetical protein [Vibrio galatheae]KJY82416.1 hypothetical protein TW81_13460 [Vibrio galatheae]
MAAQKLTRGRFVQIIIMLTILIAAFIWRTVTFIGEQNIECELKPKCTFSVKSTQFSAFKSDSGITLSKPSDNWKISLPNRALKLVEQEDYWQLQGTNLDNLQIELSDLEETHIVGVKFRI